MGLQSSKISLVQKILSVDQESIIKKIDDILDQEMIVGYTADGQSLTKNQYNERLAVAEKQLREGKVIDQEDLERESEDW
jgi:hypothetical protein